MKHIAKHNKKAGRQESDNRDITDYKLRCYKKHVFSKPDI
jgi:hypothetical protein